MPRDDFDASQIEVLNFPEPVRRRPEMYFHSDSRGMTLAVVKDLLCHALEELVLQRATSVTVRPRSAVSYEISDDGRGWTGEPHTPDGLNELCVILTCTSAGCRAQHEIDRIREEICTGSVAAANAVCSRMRVVSAVDGDAWEVEFAAGELVRGPVPVETEFEQGLTFDFELDTSIIEAGVLDSEALAAWWRGLDFSVKPEQLRIEPWRGTTGAR